MDDLRRQTPGLPARLPLLPEPDPHEPAEVAAARAARLRDELRHSEAIKLLYAQLDYRRCLAYLALRDCDPTDAVRIRILQNDIKQADDFEQELRRAIETGSAVADDLEEEARERAEEALRQAEQEPPDE